MGKSQLLPSISSTTFCWCDKPDVEWPYMASSGLHPPAFMHSPLERHGVPGLQSCTPWATRRSVYLGKSINLTILGLLGLLLWSKTLIRIIVPLAPETHESRECNRPSHHQPPVGTPPSTTQYSSIRGKYVVAVTGWGHDEFPDTRSLQFDQFDQFWS